MAHVGCQVLLVQGLAQEMEQVPVKVSEQAVCFKKVLKHHFCRFFFMPPSIFLVVFIAQIFFEHLRSHTRLF